MMSFLSPKVYNSVIIRDSEISSIVVFNNELRLVQVQLKPEYYIMQRLAID